MNDTKNGKNIARLTYSSINKLAILNSLVGIVPQDRNLNEKAAREERLAKQ